MINAADIASAFMQMLPPHEKPQFTEKKEGFYHVVSCNATCEEAEVYLIVRDFDRDAFDEPFRGGTDGAALSFRGLPCPNLSAGYENAHGRFEFVPIQSMEKNVEILLRLCSIFAGTAV